MKTFKQFLIETWLADAEEQKKKASGYSTGSRPHSLHKWNEHGHMIRHHEEGIRNTRASMEKFPGKDKVQKYGAAQIRHHEREINAHHAAREKHRWALKR